MIIPLWSVKVGLLLLAAYCRYLGTYQPNGAPKKADKVIKTTLFERFARRLPILSTGSTVSYFLLESIMLLSLKYPDFFLSSIGMSLCPVPSPSLSVVLSTIEPLFAIGTSMTILAGFLRVWCYRELGKFFSYQIAIRPDHKLVTSGPYSYVRHPGYTAAISLFLGPGLTAFSSGSYLNECKITSTKIGWIAYLWVFYASYMCFSFIRRSKTEDKVLREHFGREWDEYHRRVPYRVIPGLY
ncbi:hypothetical protein M422DRAFT_198855 [Sphaerobolus stellatus SS14]|nr:hypothetical protein M422DRAFT_198855 [Sphaerobolus stellatus SS14]